MQAALKFPHLGVRPELLAQHCTPEMHWLGLTKGLHSAPSGSVPGAAVTVGEGAGVKPPPWLLVTVGDAEEDEEGRKPLQRFCCRLHVLKAHCWSLVHLAWKLPQRGWSMKFVA